MKKLLFASTALVAFAGAAAAEVTLSGSAEMGIVGGDGIETQFWQDIDVTFKLSGTSDAGLEFGAEVSLTDASKGKLDKPFSNEGGFVFIKGDFGTLTMGDTDSAIDWALQEANIGNPGSIADNETSHAGYNGSYGDVSALGFTFNDNQVLRYDNSFGPLSFAISYAQGAISSGTGELLPGDPDGSLSIGARYKVDLGGQSVKLGLGYITHDVNGAPNVNIWGISASGNFGGGFSAAIAYSNWDGGSSGSATHFGIGGSYSSGPFTIHANYGQYDYDGPGGNDSGFGIAAAYDLGGGLSVNVGYGQSDFAGGGSDSNWSIGAVMSF
jgi:outer membrane protein OmpU